MSDSKDVLARQLKDILIELSPMIEDLTSRVCPGCEDVCCKEMHGRPTATDLACFRALGIDRDEKDDGRPLDGPCRHLGEKGCALPRWQRAWKCTWYFCDPLLRSMREGDQRTGRRIGELLSRVMTLREDLQS